MATTQHSFIATTVAAHRDVLAALRAMPRLAWAVAGILLFQAVLELALDRVIPRGSLFGRDIATIVYYALLTPYFIAVHRFIILGEVTRGYRLEWRDIRFQVFFGWAVALFVLTRVAMSNGLLPKQWTIQLVAFIVLAATCVLLTRLVILFPAIAVDAPGATPRNAFEDTRGHGWYMFFLLMFAFIPTGLIVALAGGLGFALQPLGGRILLLPILGVAMMLWLTLAVVLASRLYQRFGNRLNGSAPA